jgi:cytochrome c553
MTFSLLANTIELYKNCAGCHGENGEKMALGQSKVITGQDRNITIKQLTAYKEGELNMYGLGNIMQLQLSTFDEEDIEVLAEHIEEMKPEEPME